MKIKVGRHQRLMKALISLVCLAGTGLSALAQSPQALEEVLITGSSIKRVQAEGPLPVQTFTRQDIENSGVTSVTDFIQKLPAMQGFTTIADSVNGGGGGTTTASLHDVGEQYTLVLLNGRRVAPSSSGTTIDLNSIPLSAIERVEVLTDGASAVYGADAIAGVVNFILKQGYQPLTIDARVGVLEYGGGQQQNFAISQGWGGLQSQGYELFLSASFDKTNRLKATDREFARTGNISGTYGNLNYKFFNGSPRAIPANVAVSYTNPSIPPGEEATLYINPYYITNGKCPSSHNIDSYGEWCEFDYTSTIEIAPEVKRSAVYGSGKLMLGDSGWNLFGDLAYTNVSTLVRFAPYTATFSLPLTSYPYTNYLKGILYNDPSGPATPLLAATDTVTSVLTYYRVYDLGNRTTDYETKSLHFVTGTEGRFAGWDITGALTVSNQTQETNYPSGWVLSSAFKNLVQNGTLNPFAPIGSQSASSIAALKSAQYVGNFDTRKISMLGFDGNMQRNLFVLGGGDSVLSLGLDYRRTGYKDNPAVVASQALLLSESEQPSFDLARNNLGAYGEMLLPVFKRLDVTAAARVDQISGVDDKKSGIKIGKNQSAATYKVGTKLKASDSLAFRASYGTGFRPADMLSIAQPKVDFGVTGGTYDCPFDDPGAYFDPSVICPNNIQYEMFQKGNPDLKPEKSKQWNVGLVWEPLESLSVGLNYWSVDISDAVSSVPENLILSPATALNYLGFYDVKYVADAAESYVAIVDTPINIGRVQNRGLDWDLSYSTKFAASTIKLKIAGTHLDESRYTLPGTDDQWTSSLGQYGVNDAVSFPNVVTASAAIEYGKWEHELSMQSRDGYKDIQYSSGDEVFYDSNGDYVDGGLDVPSYATYNWRTNWAVSSTFSMTLGIENLFNEEPPRSLRSAGSDQLGYDPRYASPYMRAFSLSIRKKY